MPNKIRFSETQKFRQWWLWFILAGTKGVMGFFIVTQAMYGRPFGDSEWENISLLIGFFLMLVISMLFFFLRLETKVSDEGIFVRFYPIQLKFRHYKWEDIDQIYLREYSPIAEYGGWGIKYRGKSGKAYNISGNKGFQLVMKNGKKILLGTRKYEELLSLQNEINKKLSHGKKR